MVLVVTVPTSVSVAHTVICCDAKLRSGWIFTLSRLPGHVTIRQIQIYVPLAPEKASDSVAVFDQMTMG